MIQIIPTERSHLSTMMDSFTETHQETAQKLNKNPKKALSKAFRRSLYAKTAIIDGKIAAIWGIYGVYMGNVGYPWLLMTNEVQSHPFKVAFCYRQELKEMLQLFPTLIDIVDINHTKTVRMLKIMGFTFNEVPMEINGHLYLRAEKRA